MALVGSCFEERFYNFFMPLIKNHMEFRHWREIGGRNVAL